MKIGPEEIKKINEAYKATGTYAAAARIVGCSPSTVKRYIIPDYNSEPVVDEEEITLPPLEEIADQLPPWIDITCLTPEEEKELKALWKEMSV